jgi:hypothetical protein
VLGDYWYHDVPYYDDRFFKGHNPEAPTDHGGLRYHGEGHSNNHDLHIPQTNSFEGTDVTVASAPTSNPFIHALTDNEPPWYAVAYAIRSNHHLAFP